jgi:membrane protease YdiL (CAAX protease family)
VGAAATPLTNAGTRTRTLARYAPWFAFALMVVTGGDEASRVAMHLLGVHTAANLTPITLAIIYALREAAALALVLFGVKAIVHEPFSGVGLRRATWNDVILGLAAGVVTLPLIYLLLHFSRLPASSAEMHYWFLMTSATGAVAVAVVVVVALFSPIVQELVFRGVVMEGLLRSTAGPVAIVVSSVVFALVHAAGGPRQMAFALITGCVQGWLYSRTRSIVAPSVMHVLANGVGVYPLFLRMLHP